MPQYLWENRILVDTGATTTWTEGDLAPRSAEPPAASSSVFSERRARPALRVEQRQQQPRALVGVKMPLLPRRHRAAFPGWRLLGQQGGGLKDCLPV